MAFSVKKALTLMTRAHNSRRLAHAYLITGPEGCGKKQLAAHVASVLLDRPEQDWPPSPHPDLHILEPESKSRRIIIDQVRTLEHALRLRPAMAKVKVAILVDADRLQPHAANAFLKTLEEPPRDTHLLLLSAHPETLLVTILSRCLRVPLAPPSVALQPTEPERALFDSAASCFSAQPRTIPRLLALSREIQNYLAMRKEAIAKSFDAALKEEKSAWADNIERDWLERREAYYAALANAAYCSERDRLLLLLTEWWGDKLRASVGAPALQKLETNAPDSRPCVLRTEDILLAIERLDTLRDALGRNSQESLAFDAALLGLVSRG